MGPLIARRLDGTSMGYMKVGGVWPAALLPSALLPSALLRSTLPFSADAHTPAAAPRAPSPQAWVEGKAQGGAPVFADVRDVARAHILAAENPAASGRYIVAASHSTPAARISAWLQVGAGYSAAASAAPVAAAACCRAVHPPHPTMLPAGALPRVCV